ncbi:MAG: dipeptidase [Pseudomonadota bacterium]
MIIASRKPLISIISAFAAGLCFLASAGIGKEGAEKKESDDVLVFDLHADTLYQNLNKGVGIKKNDCHVDLEKMQKGKYLAQVFAIWVKPGKGWKTVEKMAATFWKWKSKNNTRLALATTGSQIWKARLGGQVAGVLGIEGLSPLEGDMGKIDKLYDFGVRVIGLTWFDSNDFAGTSNSKDKRGTYGLTEKGIKLVERANELGMVIDVSHASDRTVLDVAEYSTDPFIASHSCAKALMDIERNLSDELLAVIGKKGGVIGVNFHRAFVAPKPRDQVTMKDVVDQIVHISKAAGIDAVALGSDFDGAGPPADLDSAEKMQDLARALKKRGFTSEEVHKIMYLNAWRVFAAVTQKKDLKEITGHLLPEGMLAGRRQPQALTATPY